VVLATAIRNIGDTVQAMMLQLGRFMLGRWHSERQ